MSCSINEKQQRKFDIVNIFVPLFLCLQKDIILYVLLESHIGVLQCRFILNTSMFNHTDILDIELHRYKSSLYCMKSSNFHSFSISNQ
jgi:hypothetical protein